MNLKKEIPNIFTLLNLLSGTIAVILAVEGELILACIFVIIGILFDFFDGFAARILNVQSEFGKQLDSLADMITSGVVPGIILFQLLSVSDATFLENQMNVINEVNWSWESYNPIAFMGLIFTLAAAYRLANFNIDERQSTSFIGLPTPAATIFVLSLPLILEYNNNSFVLDIILNKWFLIIVTLLSSYLMNANIPLFSLKFKNIDWNNNKVKYVFLTISLTLLILLKFVAIPMIIVIYILLSLFENWKNRSEV